MNHGKRWIAWTWLLNLITWEPPGGLISLCVFVCLFSYSESEIAKILFLPLAGNSKTFSVPRKITARLVVGLKKNKSMNIWFTTIKSQSNSPISTFNSQNNVVGYLTIKVSHCITKIIWLKRQTKSNLLLFSETVNSQAINSSSVSPPDHI